MVDLFMVAQLVELWPKNPRVASHPRPNFFTVFLGYTFLHCIVHVHVHERSVIETRQSKATEDNSLFLKRKRRAASGGIRTCNVLCTRQTLYQLSHRGSSAGQAESLQRQSCLFPDKQGNSISCTCIHV